MADIALGGRGVVGPRGWRIGRNGRRTRSSRTGSWTSDRTDLGAALPVRVDRLDEFRDPAEAARTWAVPVPTPIGADTITSGALVGGEPVLVELDDEPEVVGAPGFTSPLRTQPVLLWGRTGSTRSVNRKTSAVPDRRGLGSPGSGWPTPGRPPPSGSSASSFIGTSWMAPA